ncbi:pentatricopeptide repeat-containing protein At2g01860 [Prosopis cineraria]|uniref:pentatricopeptide repeat-containing protein At2g01860 n=1 Tax=Prosopis cineraria TaxID=364024 RepID=UPI00240F69AC|nr:pentatricopeptide repeat-containing protein At2g01860 [Prosopis cineraria]XP_054808460.1 pentatricopeptide repeat-containing protein At2g01860 [Prosopis cineraria]
MDCIVPLHSGLIYPKNRTLRGYHAFISMVHSNGKRRLPKNIPCPRRPKQPPEFGVNLFLKKSSTISEPVQEDLSFNKGLNMANEEEEEEEDTCVVWEADEIEAISSLFEGRIPQKAGKLNRERPLPLPLPHKVRPLGLPTPKTKVRLTDPAAVSHRASTAKKWYKDPGFLVELAREISKLDPDKDVSIVLRKRAQFLRKGSLSLTIRELGHMGCPGRALQTFCWAQKQPELFPDDRILASTIEVLARSHELKVPFNLGKFTRMASRAVLEAMVMGFIKGGSFKLAWKLLVVARKGKRMFDSGIYAKLVLELGKNPDKHAQVMPLLDELGEREELNLSQQDCTAIMKVCAKMGKFDVVESLFGWFGHSGRDPSIVMFTTVIHSRYKERKYREALALVWEMEASNCLLDLPAYRVAIKLFVALNDISRAVRYFSKLKEAGFSPTRDIYEDLLHIYLVAGRKAKCRDICREAEIAGFKLDERVLSQNLQFDGANKLETLRIS